MVTLRLWLAVEDCLDWSVDKSIQVSVRAAMSWDQWFLTYLALCLQYLLYRWVHTGRYVMAPDYGCLQRTAWIGLYGRFTKSGYKSKLN